MKSVVLTADPDQPDVTFSYFANRAQARSSLDTQRTTLAAAPVGSRIHTHRCTNDETNPAEGCVLDRVFLKTASGWVEQ